MAGEALLRNNGICIYEGKRKEERRVYLLEEERVSCSMEEETYMRGPHLGLLKAGRGSGIS